MRILGRNYWLWCNRFREQKQGKDLLHARQECAECPKLGRNPPSKELQSLLFAIKGGKPLPFSFRLPKVRLMHPDVAKLVEAGRIPETVGKRLTELAPDSFCLHKSWGAGKVASWDLFGGKVTINFERANEPQTLGLKLAIQKTEPLEASDFRAERVEKLGELRELAEKNSTELIIRMLESHGGSLRPDQVDKELCGTIIPEKDYKKWWDKAKNCLLYTSPSPRDRG